MGIIQSIGRTDEAKGWGE